MIKLSTVAGSLLVLAALGASVPATAAVNVSINTAPYTFASYDTSGNPLATTPVNAGGDYVTNNDNGQYDVGFWTATYSFNLSSANDVLKITDLVADDIVGVFLNGTLLDSAGIYGPGTGNLFLTPTGTSIQVSAYNNGSQDLNFSGPFVAGSNTIELIVNNNNDGIDGSSLTGGPTSLGFTGLVSSAVPEPATWAMMLVGFGSLGVAIRSRRKLAATSA